MTNSGEIFSRIPAIQTTYSTAARSCEDETSASPSLTKPRICIVPDGDLLLKIEMQPYLVYSQVMRSASVVFQGILEMKYLFAKTVADPVVVNLVDDDPSIMKIILWNLHHQHKRVPQTLTIPQLAIAAVICDKYRFHEALQLISKIWIKNLEEETSECPEDWLLISWVFGLSEVFTKVSRDLMMYGVPSGKGGLVFGENRNRTISECVPAEVSKRIARLRTQCIESILNEVDALERIYLSNDGQCGLQRSKHCDALQLGHLYRAIPDGGDCIWNSSVNDIVAALDNIEALEYHHIQPPPPLPPPQRFKYCGHCSYVLDNNTFYCLRCGADNYLTYCVFCGDAVGARYHTEGHRCQTTTSVPKAPDATSGCSWVPKFKNMLREILRDIKGLEFNEFPSHMPPI